jgi:hypothetical protein
VDSVTRPAVLRTLREIMMHVILRLRRRLKEERYRPEVYYMRGPGPKTLARAKAQQQANSK